MISNDKILGVSVDQNLAWSDHIRHLSKTILLQVSGFFFENKDISFSKSTAFYFISFIFNPY